jgi:DNA adenine methylase/adenine-specific DNA-methyltransferase
MAQFPSTRYQGSKAKIGNWIGEQVKALPFKTCLDAFGGTGAVSHRLKRAGKQVTYNDILRFNYYIGLALIENSRARLTSADIDHLLQRHHDTIYPDFIQETFRNIYFTEEENIWLDQTITNIRDLKNKYKRALALFSLFQACIIKRPYNLFHRKNLYVRLANVKRSFGNKASWDAPFERWFRVFAEEANKAVFDNGLQNHATCLDAVKVEGEYDLVYIDTPYISRRSVGVDYQQFYHFLEGITIYDKWGEQIDYSSKHRRLLTVESEWCDKRRIYTAFDRLFDRFKDSILVVSYRSDGTPSEGELVDLMRKYKTSMRVEHYGAYKYVLSKNGDSKEILIIGS